MTPNKKIIEAYYASKGTEYAGCLADDVELVEWADGVPPKGIQTHGKTAFVENRGTRDYGTEIARMTEENNVVVVEGTARGAKKDGGSWQVEFCDIFELENGKVNRLRAFGASVKDGA